MLAAAASAWDAAAGAYCIIDVRFGTRAIQCYGPKNSRACADLCRVRVGTATGGVTTAFAAGRPEFG